MPAGLYANFLSGEIRKKYMSFNSRNPCTRGVPRSDRSLSLSEKLKFILKLTTGASHPPYEFRLITYPVGADDLGSPHGVC